MSGKRRPLTQQQGQRPVSAPATLRPVFLNKFPTLPRNWGDPGVCWDLQYCVIMLLLSCLVQHIWFFLLLTFWSDL